MEKATWTKIQHQELKDNIENKLKELKWKKITRKTRICDSFFIEIYPKG